MSVPCGGGQCSPWPLHTLLPTACPRGQRCMGREGVRPHGYVSISYDNLGHLRNSRVVGASILNVSHLPCVLV